MTDAGVARVAYPELVQRANVPTSDKVAAMFVFHLVSSLVTRVEVNYPPESRIPDLVDLDLVTVETWTEGHPRRFRQPSQVS
jgi:hypothetical protein